MPTSRLAKLGLIAALILGSTVVTPAADRYHVNVVLSGITTNQDLALVSHPMSRGLVLKNISNSTGIPVANLAMILERESGIVRVVDSEAGTNVAALLRLETDLSVGNTNLTRQEIFMRVRHPEQENFDGSAVATVTIKRNAQQEETGFKISGKIHVAVEATDTDRTEIYSGVFTSGAPFIPKRVQ